MTVKLKVLGLAFAAALALSAVAASTAFAQETHSDSKGDTYFTAEQHGLNQLDTPAGSIKCTTITGHAFDAGSTATEATVTNLGYDACTAFGLEATIDTMGCDYLLTGSTSTTGIVHIICPTTAGGVTDEITITPLQGGAAICHIDVPEQTVAVDVSNTSETPSGILHDIDITPEVTDTIEYSVERTTGGAKCPTNGPHNDGVYTGSITVSAFEDEDHLEEVGLTYT